MDIGARPDVCVVYVMFLMFVLTLADGLCCAWFIYPLMVLVSGPLVREGASQRQDSDCQTVINICS
jgi:hypothetical protein